MPNVSKILIDYSKHVQVLVKLFLTLQRIWESILEALKILRTNSKRIESFVSQYLRLQNFDKRL